MRFDLGEKAGEENDDDRADAESRRTRQQIGFFIIAMICCSMALSTESSIHPYNTPMPHLALEIAMEHASFWRDLGRCCVLVTIGVSVVACRRRNEI